MNKAQKLLYLLEDSLSVQEPISTLPDDPATNPINPLREMDDEEEEDE